MAPKQRVELTGTRGGPVLVADDTMSMAELARRIAYIFHKAAREKKAGLIEGAGDGGA
jgi:hypothetical protein